LLRENDDIRKSSVMSGVLPKDSAMWSMSKRLPGTAATFCGILFVLERSLECAARDIELNWGVQRPVLPRVVVAVHPKRDPSERTVDDGSVSGECGFPRELLEAALASFQPVAGCRTRTPRKTVTDCALAADGSSHVDFPLELLPVSGDDFGDPMGSISDEMLGALVAAVDTVNTLSKEATPVQMSQDSAEDGGFSVNTREEISNSTFVAAAWALAKFAGCGQRLLNYSCDHYHLMRALGHCDSNEAALNTVLDFPCDVPSAIGCGTYWQSPRGCLADVMKGIRKRVSVHMDDKAAFAHVEPQPHPLAPESPEIVTQTQPGPSPPRAQQHGSVPAKPVNAKQLFVPPPVLSEGTDHVSGSGGSKRVRPDNVDGEHRFVQGLSQVSDSVAGLGPPSVSDTRSLAESAVGVGARPAAASDNQSGVLMERQSQPAAGTAMQRPQNRPWRIMSAAANKGICCKTHVGNDSCRIIVLHCVIVVVLPFVCSLRMSGT
jgi:hypothetical protein